MLVGNLRNAGQVLIHTFYHEKNQVLRLKDCSSYHNYKQKIMTRLDISWLHFQSSRAPDFIVSHALCAPIIMVYKLLGQISQLRNSEVQNPNFILSWLNWNFFLVTLFLPESRNNLAVVETIKKKQSNSWLLNNTLGVNTFWLLLFFLWAFPSFTFPPWPVAYVLSWHEVTVVGTQSLVPAHIGIWALDTDLDFHCIHCLLLRPFHGHTVYL